MLNTLDICPQVTGQLPNAQAGLDVNRHNNLSYKPLS